MKPFRVTPLTFLCLALFLSIGSRGATWGHEIKIVAPNEFENAEGDTSVDFSFINQSSRTQVTYAASEFGSLPESHRIITAISFRPDAAITDPRTVVWEDTQWLLSTSTTGVDERSVVFAENHGPNLTLVYEGDLVTSTLATGPPQGPRGFDYRVELQTPFFYDPSEGNLVVDVTLAGYSPSLGDDQTSLRNQQLLNFPFVEGAESGFFFDKGLIMEFTFVPEPSTFVLLAFGLAGLLGVALLRRR